MAFKTHKILPQIQFFLSIQINELKRSEEKTTTTTEKQNKTNEILSEYQISNIKCE